MTQQEEKILKEKLNKEYGKVHGFVKRRVNRSDEAEDLVQEIFYYAAVNLNSLQSIDSVMGWLYRIASNKVIDWYRKRKIKTVDIDYASAEIEMQSLEELVDKSDINIEDPEVREFMLSNMYEWIDQLPAAQRSVLIQNVFEDKTMDQISKEEKVPLNTLLSRKRYAILTLREKLNELINKIKNQEVII